ncbi:hypothetical protein COOONC_10781, partial [Cooperia oncophora]
SREPGEVDNLFNILGRQERNIVLEPILTRSSEQNITDMTLNDFKSAVPQIGWRDLLGAELSPILKLTDETMVSVINLEYFNRLALLVSRYSLQTMANYLVVVTVKHLETFALLLMNNDR